LSLFHTLPLADINPYVSGVRRYCRVMMSAKARMGAGAMMGLKATMGLETTIGAETTMDER
jgi:hypothetical protein